MGNPRTLLVLYATQTGTAQEVAESIVRQARARAFHVQLASMDEYDRVSWFTILVHPDFVDLQL
jgi:sulfite reductase alpha subunit-like flavoprotein